MQKAKERETKRTDTAEQHKLNIVTFISHKTPEKYLFSGG